MIYVTTVTVATASFETEKEAASHIFYVKGHEPVAVIVGTEKPVTDYNQCNDVSGYRVGSQESFSIYNPI